MNANVGGHDHGEAWHLVHTTRAETAARDAVKAILGADAIYRPVMVTHHAKARRLMTRAARKVADATGIAATVVREVALYPRYLFVRFDPDWCVWHDVMRRVGFEGLAVNGARPGRVPDALVEKLKALEVGGVIPGNTPANALPYTLGEIVRIRDGAFAGHNAAIEEIDESGRVCLLLSLFGQTVRATLTAAQLEKL